MFSRKITLIGVSALAMAMANGTAFAQTTAEDSAEADDEVITVIGSRGKPRSVTDSPVAVDSLGADELASTGATETGRILQELVPSFNFSSSSVSDGTDSLLPATLRGLGPDQTLVLVNGKRRHKAALIHVNTSVGRGTAGTDISAIPASALKRVDVLRDGASALYGSDAIAGVINFELRDDPEAGNVTGSIGQTYDSDGLTFLASINKGFGFGDGGFVNITYEYRNKERTNRAGLSATCQFLCNVVGGQIRADPSTEAREIAFNRQNFRIGDSESVGHSVFVNAGAPVSDIAELYAFGGWSTRRNESGGFYRRANQGSRTLLALYPDGFLPLIRPKVEDMSLAFGINWELGDNFKLDTSVNYGSNSYTFQIANSNNVSLGLASPTVFDAGTLELSEWSGNIDAVYLMGDFSAAFGVGYRTENYQLIAGEPDSFADGGFINTDTINVPPLFGPTAGSAGAQVFRGFSPANAVDESRDSLSAYLELTADLGDRVNLQAAGRYENYQGFGGSFTGKIAGLFTVTDGFKIRGSVTTGFRAPSMQQLFFNSTSTQFVTVMGMTVAQERGTFRNDSALAGTLGIPELQEETSFSYGGGVIFEPVDGLTITADYYHIDIDDRIMISGAINPVTPAIQAAFDAAGATQGQFFINGVDTSTDGIDVVASYKVPGDILGGALTLTSSFNYNKTNVTELPAPGLLAGLDLVTAQDVSIIEEWQPRTRFNAGANWKNDNWGFGVQLAQYGKYTVCEGGCTGAVTDTQEFGAKWLTDIQLDYKFDMGLKLSIGANNLFDVVPDLNLIGQSRGGALFDSAGNEIVTSPGVFQFSRRSAPFGFNGGYYYFRASFDF
ncbi:MAG: TonB-dependent receptor [Sphingorhabdus sp.]